MLQFTLETDMAFPSFFPTSRFAASFVWNHQSRWCRSQGFKHPMQKSQPLQHASAPSPFLQENKPQKKNVKTPKLAPTNSPVLVQKYQANTQRYPTYPFFATNTPQKKTHTQKKTNKRKKTKKKYNTNTTKTTDQKPSKTLRQPLPLVWAPNVPALLPPAMLSPPWRRRTHKAPRPRAVPSAIAEPKTEEKKRSGLKKNWGNLMFFFFLNR